MSFLCHQLSHLSINFYHFQLKDTPGWPSSGCSICIYFLDKMKEFKGLSSQQRTSKESSLKDDITCNLCFKVTPEIMIDVTESHKDVFDTKVVSDMLSLDVKDLSDWPGNGCWDCIDFLEKVIVFQKRTLASHNSLTARSRDPPLQIKDSTVSRIKKPLKRPKTIITPRKPPTYNSVVRHIENASPEELKLEELMLEMRLFVCRVCNLDCSNFKALKGHVRSTHDYDEYNICCDYKLKGVPLLSVRSLSHPPGSGCVQVRCLWITVEEQFHPEESHEFVSFIGTTTVLL